MIKVVIFDFGGVVDNWADKITYRYIAHRFKLSYKLVMEKFEKDLINKMETRKISETEAIKRFFSSIKRDLPRDYKTLWNKKFNQKFGVNKNVVKIVKDIKRRGYKVALLSNNQPSRANLARRRGYLKYFNPKVFSHEVGMRKPDKGIYLLILKKLRVKPEECIFIDNRPENLIPAKKLGIKTIWFKNAARLKKELNKIL